MIYKLSSTQQRRCLLLEQQTVYDAGRGRGRQQTEGEVGRQDMRNLFSKAVAAC